MIVRHIYRHTCSAQHESPTHTSAPPCYCLCCLYALTADATRPRHTHCQACHIGHAYQRHARITNAQHIRRKYPPHCRPGVALLFLLAILLAILHAYHQRRNACTVYPGRIATTRTQSAGACNQRQALHLTHSPTIQRRKASRNYCRQFRQPGPNQPPQLAPIGQRFPAFPPDICGRSATTRAGILARLLAYLCMNVCIFAYSQQKLYTIFDMRPQSLDFTGFQGLHFMHSAKKSFHPGQPSPQSLDFTVFADSV